MCPETGGAPAVGRALDDHSVTVLLVDDQVIIGEAVRRMLLGEKDIHYHFCNDPSQALQRAEELKPTVVLQDLVMPQMDGLDLVRAFRAAPATRDVPLIVLSTKEDPRIKAEAFARGANDYLVKLPDRVELLARIRYHSRGYISLLQRNEAYQALLASQQRLAGELAEAAEYVKSLLPEPLSEPLRTAWEYIPSTQLGGDAFGYHWVDPEHLAVYLLDVCGHGVGAALLAVAAVDAIRSQTLPGTDFRSPARVLEALNAAFPMEKHNGMYFTIWYGVFDRTSRQLVYACGGHPPAVLIENPGAAAPTVHRLRPGGLVIGAMPDIQYDAGSCAAPPGSVLYVFSDGVYEITQADGSLWAMDEFIKLLAQPSEPGVPDGQRILKHVRQVHAAETFDDDFSLLRVGL